MAARGDLRSLVEAMGHAQPYMRLTASDLLASQGNKAFPLLIEALTHDNPDVRKGAARALGLIGDRRAVRYLLDRLDKENSGVGQFIVDALAEIGDVQVVPVLCRTTRSHSLSLRYSAVRALGKLGDRRAIPFLIEALGDTASIVRLRAVESLANMEEPTLWVPISEMLADQSAGVRAVAARVLGEMHCLRAIDYLLPLLESDIESDVLETVRALGRIGSKKALEPLLIARAREGRERVIQAIEAALQAIGETSQD